MVSLFDVTNRLIKYICKNDFKNMVKVSQFWKCEWDTMHFALEEFVKV
mgnify:CR=1 FL=1